MTKIVILFPGYGSQFVGMGKDLYDNSRIMQEYFEEASTVLNINFVKLCFAASDVEISKIEHALAANFLVSTSIYAIIKEQTSQPFDIVAGHDSGEYAALFAAGGISFPDMLYLIQKYVGFYQELRNELPVKIIKVTGLDSAKIEEIVAPFATAENKAFISIYVSTLEHIISGHQDAVSQIQEQLTTAGAKKITELPQIDGLHSPLMQGVESQVRTYAEKVDFKDLTTPLLTATHAHPINTKDQAAQEIFAQITMPIRWIDSVKALEAYDLIIEVGPGSALSSQLRKIYPEKKIVSVNNENDVKALQEMLKVEKT